MSIPIQYNIPVPVYNFPISRLPELPANLLNFLNSSIRITRLPELPANLQEYLDNSPRIQELHARFQEDLRRLQNEPNRRRNLNLEKKIANENGEKCVICDEKYKNGENICNTECNHVFHFDCLEEWCQIRQNCPLCRRDVSIN